MTANNETLRLAFQRAMKNISKDRQMLASATSAGFIFDVKKRGKREGYQVFVKVCRYSDDLLKRKPRTGGLYDML